MVVSLEKRKYIYMSMALKGLKESEEEIGNTWVWIVGREITYVGPSDVVTEFQLHSNAFGSHYRVCVGR